MMPARLLGALGVVVLLVGCTSPSLSSPAASLGSPDVVSDLMRPENCSTTVFRTPGGDILDLSGKWVHAVVGGPPPTEAPITDGTGLMIRQSGDCVWAVDQWYGGSGPNLRRNVFVWYGRLTTDLQINGVEIFLSNGDPTSLNNTAFGAQVAFGPEGGLFLCDRREPHCPVGITTGDPIMVRVDQ